MQDLREIFGNDWIKFRGRAIRPLSLAWWIYRGLQFAFYVGILSMGYLTIYAISFFA